MDSALRKLAYRQDDLVASWQLKRLGWSRAKVEHAVRSLGWRRVHRGVYAISQAPLSKRQLWVAAILTSPGSVLSHASAGDCFGFRPYNGSHQTVTRPGSGGPRRFGTLLVVRSTTLSGDTTRHHGIPITTAARALLDLAPGLDDRAKGKCFREALRLKLTTAGEVGTTAARHHARLGALFLGDLATRYTGLPYNRARSDAEARALEILHDAGIDPPQLNIRIAGEEADLVWTRRRRIIEIDGPQYHQFRDEDLRKQGIWERAGFTVRRIASDLVFAEPARLLGLVAG